MFKVGILGSDNSHALAFSKISNLPDEDGKYLFPDIRVTAIYGHDKEQTQTVAKQGKIEFIAQNPEDLIGVVDAVMVVFRHGGLHAEYALPFIKAGIPTWVDKPFAISNEDAAKMIEAAKNNDTLLTGGSTLKYISDIKMLKNEVQIGCRVGKIRSGVINFPATLTNEYGGIYFYGAHLAEMTLEAFGYDYKSVIASEQDENVMAILKYDRYQVMMNFIPASKEFCALLYGDNGTLRREIDIAGCYLDGFMKFVEMLRTNILPEPFENLYGSVALLNNIVKAYESGKEIKV